MKQSDSEIIIKYTNNTTLNLDITKYISNFDWKGYFLIEIKYS